MKDCRCDHNETCPVCRSFTKLSTPLPCPSCASLRYRLALAEKVVEDVIADTRKWYAEDIFGPVDEKALKLTNLRYPGTVDRLSADMARRTCDLILNKYRDALRAYEEG